MDGITVAIFERSDIEDDDHSFLRRNGTVSTRCRECRGEVAVVAADKLWSRQRVCALLPEASTIGRSNSPVEEDGRPITDGDQHITGWCHGGVIHLIGAIQSLHEAILDQGENSDRFVIITDRAVSQSPSSECSASRREQELTLERHRPRSGLDIVLQGYDVRTRS